MDDKTRAALLARWSELLGQVEAVPVMVLGFDQAGQTYYCTPPDEVLSIQVQVEVLTHALASALEELQRRTPDGELHHCNVAVDSPTS